MEQLSSQQPFLFSVIKKYEKKSLTTVKQFYLPSLSPNNFDFNNIHDVMERLNQQQCLKYFRIKRRGKYVYFQCKFCLAKIVLIQEGRIRLVRYNNFHRHETGKNKKIEQELILEMIESSNNIQSPQKLRQRILSTISVSQRRYNYILRKFIDNDSVKNGMEFLERQQYWLKISNSGDQELPQLLLFMSNQQRKQAIKFNDTFGFDITYNLLKNRSKDNKQWGVGVFSTFDSNLRIIPVAFALILRQNTQTFAKLFRGFLQFVESRTCTIVTDNQASIRAGLQNLIQNGIYNGNYVLDSFHLLRNIKKKVAETDFALYHTIITTKYPKKYIQAMQILEKRYGNRQMLSQIRQNKQRYCFSMSCEKFIGLALSTSGTEKCNDFIKTLIPRETNFYRLILAFHRIQNKIKNTYKPKFEIKKYQKIFDDERIKEVRQGVQEKIFKIFLNNYIKGLRCQIQLISEQQDIFIVKGIRTTGKNCQCYYNIRTGIPCFHMLAVLIRGTRTSYLGFFNWRWTDLIKNETYQRIGARKSRRRRN